MKPFYSLIVTVLAMTFISNHLSAQVPYGMNYQAIARNAIGAPLANQNVCIRSSITDGNGGAVLYSEDFNVVTNQFGLFTLSIGTGTPVTGTFGAISWANVNAWQEIQMDINCTGTFVTMGSSQLLSVPYAFHAADAPNKSIGGTGITISNNVINSVWTQGGNHIFNNNTGNVGIGMYPLLEKLEVAGGIRLSDAANSNNGIIQYNTSNGDFEGYSNGRWRSFTRNKYQTLSGFNLSSSLRNTLVLSNDSIVIAETGNYFLSFNVNGANSGTGVNTDYDYSSSASVYKTSSGGITNNIPFFSYYEDIATSFTAFRYMPQYTSTSIITSLNAGDVLKVAAYVSSTGSPTGNWSLNRYEIRLLKLD